MFTSKEPGRFPRDPQPYTLTLPHVTPQRAARVTFTGEQGGVRIDFAPRPEFNTPVNPILSGLREDVENSEDFTHDTVSHAEFWLSILEDQEAFSTPEQIEHARKVLARLTALENGGSE